MPPCCCSVDRGQNRPMHKQDGPWAWFVLGCAFLQSWLSIGILRAYGIFLPILMEEFNQGRDTIALISSIGLGGGHLLSMIATWLNTVFQNRLVCFIGHLSFTLAFSLSALVYKIELMYFTFGFFIAVGLAFVSTTHVLIIFKYFHRHRSLAQGVNASGGALGMMTVPILLQYLVDKVGWRSTFHICAGSFGLFGLLSVAYSPHVKIDLPDINDKVVPNQYERSPNSGKELEDETAHVSGREANEEITEAYHNAICYDAADSTKTYDNNECETPSQYDSYECTADQNNMSHEVQKNKHDNNQSTADQRNQTDANNAFTADKHDPTEGHAHDKCTADQRSSSFAHDNHQCTAGHENLAFVHDQQLSVKGCQSKNDELYSNNLERADGSKTTVNLPDRQKSSKCMGLLDFSVWRNSNFVIATISICISTFSIFSSSIHLVKFAEEVGLSATEAATLYTFIGISSLIGRIVSGKVCDIAWVNPNIVLIITLLLASLGVFLYTLGKTYLHLAIISAIFGISDGMFRTLLTVILTTCVESSKVSAALGQALSASAVFVLGGPAITGLLADKLGGYNIAYYMNGSILIGAAAVLLMPTILKHCRKSRDYTINHMMAMSVVCERDEIATQ